jgi:hypothetical protein
MVVPASATDTKKEETGNHVPSDGLVLLTSEAGHVSVKSATAERLVERLLDPSIHGSLP